MSHVLPIEQVALVISDACFLELSSIVRDFFQVAYRHPNVLYESVSECRSAV